MSAPAAQAEEAVTSSVACTSTWWPDLLPGSTYYPTEHASRYPDSQRVTFICEHANSFEDGLMARVPNEDIRVVTIGDLGKLVSMLTVDAIFHAFPNVEVLGWGQFRWYTCDSCHEINALLSDARIARLASFTLLDAHGWEGPDADTTIPLPAGGERVLLYECTTHPGREMVLSSGTASH